MSGRVRKMATIYDVAAYAGVSPKTVSRVINSDAPVSEKTRSKVETAIAALGYIPSSAARISSSILIWRKLAILTSATTAGL